MNRSMSDIPVVDRVIVLGGGSAGFIAAIALKAKIPALAIRVIRSKDIGVIGVGEGSTPPMTRFLHDFIGVGQKKFFETAKPTWKLGLKFIWGPRPSFHYPFGHHLETVFAGKHHIQDNGVEGFALREYQLQRRLTISGDNRLMAFGFKIEAQALGQMLLVFDQEYPAHLSWQDAAVRG